MKNYKMLLSTILLVLMTASPDIAAAQAIKIIPHAGVSKDMRSLTSNRWNSGLNLGAYLFFQGSDWLFVGGRIAYHSWSADEEGWFQDLKDSFRYSSRGYNYSLQSIDGAQSVIEIAPTLRFSLSPAEAPTKFYLQGGVALLFISEREVTIKTTFSGPNTSGSEQITISGRSMIGSGLQLGASLVLGNVVEVMPIYTVYLAGGDPYHHIAFTVGIALGI